MKTIFLTILFIVLGLISACNYQPRLVATPMLSRDKAIEIAVESCKIPHLVLVSEPKNIRASQLTLDQADILTKGAGEITNFTLPRTTIVWFVHMDGLLQIVGGPPPIITQDRQIATPTQPQPIWGTCSVTIDANSGVVISVHG